MRTVPRAIAEPQHAGHYASLSDGDVGSLAENLRDAFGATVVGLLVGTVAFALTLARTRMYSEDLADLEQGSEAILPAPVGAR